MKKLMAITIAAVASVALPLTASAHDNGYRHSHQSSQNNQVTGGLIGAVIGGVIGSNVAGTGVQREGTAIGALAGAVIGSSLRGQSSSQNGHYNSGHYQQQTQQPIYQSHSSSGHYSSGHYQQQPYQQVQHSHSSSQPVYGYTRPSISINLSSFGQSHYRSNRRRNNRGHYHGRNYCGSRH